MTANRAALDAHQLAAARTLTGEVLARNPFYGAKLRAAGIEAPPETLAAFHERVPFTSKRELMEDQLRNPPYGTNLTYPLERYTRFFQTSATTGAPMRWLDTPESWDWMLGCWARVFESAGVTAADHIFFAFSFGPFLGFWTAFGAAERIGCLCIPGGGMRSAARLRTMLAAGATVLCCTPTYAIHLAETARAEGIDLSGSKVRAIVVAGEPGGSVPGTRACIERLWPGARVVDHHGMTEVGPVSYACPARAGVLHIMEAAYIPEVIDPATGRAAIEGELVLTNLGRTGSPLLRYRTGDFVRPAKDAVCACGSAEMALEGGIVGRTDDMVVVRGVNVYPSAVEDVLRACGGVAEYRARVSRNGGLAELTLEIEPDGDGPAAARRAEAALHSALGLRVAVAPVEAGSLPRFEMKAQRWFRE